MFIRQIRLTHIIMVKFERYVTFELFCGVIIKFYSRPLFYWFFALYSPGPALEKRLKPCRVAFISIASVEENLLLLALRFKRDIYIAKRLSTV